MQDQVCRKGQGNRRRRAKEPRHVQQAAISCHFAEIDPGPDFPAIRSHPGPGELKQAMMLIERVVEMVVRYLQEAAMLIGNESSPYLERFQHTFGQSLLIASYLSDAFVLDLKQGFPPLWERVRQAQQERQRQVQQFYEHGIIAGVFQPINPALVVLQDELILRSIMDPVFLMEHDLRLRSVLYDYYELQKYQLLAPEVFKQVDDAPVKEYIDMMARKITLSMRSDLAL